MIDSRCNHYKINGQSSGVWYGRVRLDVQLAGIAWITTANTAISFEACLSRSPEISHLRLTLCDCGAPSGHLCFLMYASAFWREHHLAAMIPILSATGGCHVRSLSLKSSTWYQPIAG